VWTFHLNKEKEIVVIIKLSVRELVEDTLLSGSITSMGFGTSKTLEGMKAHKQIQKSRGENYKPEVIVNITYHQDDFVLEIGGRIDGVYVDEGVVVIEEIKTTSVSLDSIQKDFNRIHVAQGEIYAYIYAKLNSLEWIRLRITYHHRESGENLSFYHDYSFRELENFFLATVNDYLQWTSSMFSWAITRDSSLASLDFPFMEFRKGQKTLVSQVYKAIENGERLFVQAPTGTGKTMATIFPSLKALGKGQTSKIFYLTAKTITRSIGENALNILYNKGMRLKSITITAKEKVCPCPELFCMPEECEYAKGYYDRIKAAIKRIFLVDVWDKNTIEEYSKEFQVCPFEFSLDLSIWADIVICDYNYAFDPRVRLKRFFSETNMDFTLLIDEAHNLVDRGREMFSASLKKSSFLKLMKKSKTLNPSLLKSIREINRYFIDLRKVLDEEKQQFVVSDFEKTINSLIPYLIRFTYLAAGYLEKDYTKENKEDLLSTYFECLNFLNISDIFDDKYQTYFEKADKDINLKLFCIDPSSLLRVCMNKTKSVIFFSATLTPVIYYKNLLGGDVADNAILINSPFPPENLSVIVAQNISTKFVNRSKTLDSVVSLLHSMVSTKKGNYLAYFPSYKYLNDCLELFSTIYPDIKVVLQESNMSEEERGLFLDNFKEENLNSLLGFAVMGGVFGEGIDLFGDKLIGAAIVGVGLPQICTERELIKEHFQKTIKKGFEYSYVFPGMNKVLQAAGRVIRTERDKGVVFLIDERFAQYSYKKLFPRHWNHAKYL